jgi:small GTP-binding protein
MIKKIKLVLLGNSAAGKSCIVQRMIYNTFNVNNTSTIGAAFTCFSIDKNIRIEMWDTAGQERYNSLIPMYARSAEIVAFVIDIEKNIDEQILKWNKYIQENEKMFAPHYKIIYLFNKHDLNTGFEIPKTISLMSNSQIAFVTIVSAKTGHNIDKFKFHLEQTAKKIVDECARRVTNDENVHCGSNNGNNSHSNNNNSHSNIENEANGTIFGSAFSNMKINVDLQEYRESVKKYYENSRC